MSFKPLGLDVTIVVRSSRNDGVMLCHIVLGDVVSLNMVFVDMVLVDAVVGPGPNGMEEPLVNLGGRWSQAHLIATLGG
ncbi:unnamed protein product [Prunus armeniaca]|uniref:Uncharacterized protein n=1 Tax=Prunus armeniaca TaxID=36596 RepID=A0A6J5W2L0_PRUAR|nr:unnamed protein product [Prunus armeniaca]